MFVSHQRTYTLDLSQHPVVGRMIIGLVALFFVTFSLGMWRTMVGVDVPPELQAYVGTWRAGDSFVRLGSGGSIRYRLNSDHGSSSGDGAVRRYAPDELTTEFMFIPIRFRISAPPHVAADGSTHMTVDGFDFTKVR